MGGFMRVLHLEDDPLDAELVHRRLDAEGLRSEFVLADSQEAFESALADAPFDLVFLDYTVPGYSGRHALAHMREHRPDVPVIMVSGALGDEEAVECIKAGAEDYVLKDHLDRLGSAVRRALRNADERRMRSAAERALRESEQRLDVALEASNLAVWEWRLASGEVSFSHHWWPILGYAPGEIPLRVEAWAALTDSDDFSRVKAALAEYFKNPAQVFDIEYRMRAKDGSAHWIRSMGRIVERGRDGRVARMTGVHGDVTARRQHEDKIISLSRIHVLLSQINSLMLRAADRQQVLQKACDIAVGAGGYRMAWIGFVDPQTLEVKPAAVAGFDDGYLALLRPSVNPEVRGGQGIVGRALRAKQPVVLRDIVNDPRATQPQAAGARGYRSAIALLIGVDEAVSGVLCIYAARVAAFDDEEIKLLSELAADISFALDHIRKREQLDYLAYYDLLTGLPNRALFIDRCDQLLRRAQARGRKVGLMLVDLERFRHVNETLGRHAGDSLIRVVAQRLRGALSESRGVARVGANCFAVVDADVHNAADMARLYNDTIVPAIGEPIVLQGGEYRFAVKAGIALVPDDGHDATTALTHAESALNRAKSGGDRYVFYEPQMNAHVAARLTLESRLRRALQEESFTLHYQPKFSTLKGALTGLEALIRWSDGERGLIAPGEFIPLLEETGLVREVGIWVLRQAALDVRKWRDAGVTPPRIALNVSAVQLRQSDFVETLRASLLAGVGPRTPQDCGFDLEITETVIMRDIESHIPLLARIREMGMKVHVDDFGTGFSSLQYIALLPIDALKIDRSFVANVAVTPTGTSVVSGIISLAHSLGLSVIAEGVETAEQRHILGALGCDEVQGYLLGRPVAANEVPALCAR